MFGRFNWLFGRQNHKGTSKSGERNGDTVERRTLFSLGLIILN